MGSLFLYTIAALLGLAALGYWTPVWSDPLVFARRVGTTLKDWRSVRAYVLVFAVVLFVAGAVAARPVTNGWMPNGSREHVYAAVKAFQSKERLVVDGVVGPVTFAKLYPR